MTYSPHQLAYFAHQLTLRGPADSMDRMAGALLDAQVDLNPHQIVATLFATRNPLSRDAVLADEKELDRRSKETRTKSKGAVTLAEMLSAQKVRCELETQRDRKRRERFVCQDEIHIKRDALIDDLEKQLSQRVAQQAALTYEWRMA